MAVERSTAVAIILEALHSVIDQSGLQSPAALDENSVIVGQGAVLDSLGLVALIVDVEQGLEDKHHVSITLASDKAMSAKNSPFRTVGVMAEHIVALAAGGTHG